MSNYERIGTFFAVALIIVFVSLIIALLIKWIWNGIMPDIFGLPEITFWNAYGLCLLLHLLLRGVTINEK